MCSSSCRCLHEQELNLSRSSIDRTSEVLKIFFETASSASSTFHTEKAEANPAVLHAEGASSGYEQAKDAIAKDLKHVMQAHGSQNDSVTYSVHYSDVNGLSRLENYILGLEIANYLSQSTRYNNRKNFLLTVNRGPRNSIPIVDCNSVAPC